MGSPVMGVEPGPDGRQRCWWCLGGSEDLESVTPESTAIAKELKRRGFAFVGPTVAYSLMQAVGIVNDHLSGCAFRDG